MSENNYEVPASPGTREEVYLDAILRGLNNSSPTPEIPAPVWRTEQYLAAIAEAAKTPALPPVTSSDNGKVLAVEDGAWAAQQKKFIVTLTPSDATFTYGQMDKTAGEIKQAVDAGMEVWFQVTLNENLTGLYVCNGIDHYPNASFEYVFVAMFVIIFGSDAFLVRITTSSIENKPAMWYGNIYTLTPAS